jgi:maltose-binding protein MalE
MQPVWTVMKNALNEITDNQNNLLRAIEETEQKLATQGFFQRISELKS